MSVSVEFFGVVRERAGAAGATSDGSCLGDVLSDLAKRFPRLAAECFDGRRLASGYVASVAGQRFVSDPETPLAAGDSLLLLSLDAGG